MRLFLFMVAPFFPVAWPSANLMWFQFSRRLVSVQLTKSPVRNFKPLNPTPSPDLVLAEECIQRIRWLRLSRQWDSASPTVPLKMPCRHKKMMIAERLARRFSTCSSAEFVLRTSFPKRHWKTPSQLPSPLAVRPMPFFTCSPLPTRPISNSL